MAHGRLPGIEMPERKYLYLATRAESGLELSGFMGLRAWVGLGLGLFKLGLEPVGPGIIAEYIGKKIFLSVIKPAGFGANWARASLGFWLM